MRTTAKLLVTLLDAVSSALSLFVKCCMVVVIGLWPDAVMNKARPHARTQSERDRVKREREREKERDERREEREEAERERETHAHTHTHALVSLHSQALWE